MCKRISRAIRLAAHLAGAADDVTEAIAAFLATLEAKEAFNRAHEAILSGTSSSHTVSFSVVFTLAVVASRGAGEAHLHSLGLSAGGHRGLGSVHGIRGELG